MKVKFTKSQLDEGKKKEREHLKSFGSNWEMVKKVVEDHLKEDPQYYKKIKKVGL